ncbi:hypothetical protein V3I05_04050 [Helicobacter mastomyrinus]|uniref:TerC family integral membrane protein n=2 Tax=Helicobacter TaxID=209 RepID=A0ABZ3F911_9HELI
MQDFDSLSLQETFISLLLYHKIFAYFFALPFVLNLLTLFFASKNLVRMNKKIWFIAPITFFLLSVSVLSGVNLWVFGDIKLSLPLIAMITFCIFVFVGELFRIKILKVAKRTSFAAMQSYVKFCKILYGLDLLFFILLIWLV